ncbi:hypothetical protein CHH83_01845 [Bacillus sp. 7586-K]|nr:hypothetical protein CHH83_01845 [Bacillus sp. 7586-K]
MNKSQQIIKNVEWLLENYGDKVNTDKKLILLYWQLVDEIQMDKINISTKDFILKATMPNEILDAKCLIDLRNGMNEV